MTDMTLDPKDMLRCRGVAYFYVHGYRFIVGRDFGVYTGIRGHQAAHHYFALNRRGYLWVKAGYAWDGASGPTIDDESTLRASLVHDVLYQALRLGLLPADLRLRADQLFYRMLREDGMSRMRATYWYWGVRLGGAAHAAKED